MAGKKKQKDSDTIERIAPDHQVLALLRLGTETATKVAALNGTLGKSIKAAADNGFLNKKALAEVRKMMKMDALALSAYIRARDIYVGYAVKGGLLQMQADLLDHVDQQASQEGAEAAGDTDEAQTATNVTRLKRGISKLPDEEAAKDQAATTGRGPGPSGVTIQ